MQAALRVIFEDSEMDPQAKFERIAITSYTQLILEKVAEAYVASNPPDVK